MVKPAPLSRQALIALVVVLVAALVATQARGVGNAQGFTAPTVAVGDVMSLSWEMLDPATGEATRVEAWVDGRGDAASIETAGGDVVRAVVISGTTYTELIDGWMTRYSMRSPDAEILAEVRREMFPYETLPDDAETLTTGEVTELRIPFDGGTIVAMVDSETGLPRSVTVIGSDGLLARSARYGDLVVRRGSAPSDLTVLTGIPDSELAMLPGEYHRELAPTETIPGSPLSRYTLGAEYQGLSLRYRALTSIFDGTGTYETLKAAYGGIDTSGFPVLSLVVNTMDDDYRTYLDDELPGSTWSTLAGVEVRISPDGDGRTRLEFVAADGFVSVSVDDRFFGRMDTERLVAAVVASVAS